MSRVFAPLEADHPCVTGDHKNAWCAVCGGKFREGDRLTLVPIETPEESGSLTVEARAVHALCNVMASEVLDE